MLEVNSEASKMADGGTGKIEIEEQRMVNIAPQKK
jgi:hypothetical protein